MYYSVVIYKTETVHLIEVQMCNLFSIFFLCNTSIKYLTKFSAISGFFSFFLLLLPKIVTSEYPNNLDFVNSECFNLTKVTQNNFSSFLPCHLELLEI